LNWNNKCKKNYESVNILIKSLKTFIMKKVSFKAILSFLFIILSRGYAIANGENIVLSTLRCEFRVYPMGIDVLKPRLSWSLQSNIRGEKQTACQVLVASSPELLAKGKGDLWNSGKITSTENMQEYAGVSLKSRQSCYWKIKVWGQDGKPSSWSQPAYWTMGLLKSGDWEAQWISDQVLADPSNRPMTPISCYRSKIASTSDVTKWITLDLDTIKRMNWIALLPARPQSLNGDFRTFMFPLRFKIEVAKQKNFSDAKLVVDQSKTDFINPRKDGFDFHFDSIESRYVRLTVTRLSRWDGQEYALALGGFKVFDGNQLISNGTTVECSDSEESEFWSKRFLTDETNEVKYAPDSPNLSDDVKELKSISNSYKVSKVPMLRRDFSISNKISRATLYVTSRGFYEFRINGNRVSNDLLAPGFTDYNKRLSYQTYDVTQMVKTGANAMGAMLGYGWYAGHMDLYENRGIYGLFPLLLVQLEVELSNGKRETICSDNQWQTTLSGPILWSDILDGEAYDCRREFKGWDKPGFNGENWKSAYVQKRDTTRLVWQRTQPVHLISEIKSTSVKKVKPGVYVFDFGQEIAGWCRLNVNGSAGTHITVRHAENVSSDGNIDTQSLWGTQQQDDYILDGKGSRTFTPHFTYHGFRYVEVSGLSEVPDSNTLTGISIHTDAPVTGQFKSSNQLYNQYMNAVRWTQWNLLFDVPAGCAARSERDAWLGDIRPCVQTAIFNMDVAAFFEKYTQDIRDAQTPNGSYTDITPFTNYAKIGVGSPGWADAGVSLPWQVYENYGNINILKEHYESAKRWVDFIYKQNPRFIWENERGYDWGDWLSAGPETPKVIGSTAFFAHSTDLVSRMARVLGNVKDEKYYQKLFTVIKQAFVQRFVNADGIINEVPTDTIYGRQGSYALALYFNLLDEPFRTKAVNHLVQLIDKNGYHPTTGFWSSVEMLLALSENGHQADAARMLNIQTVPSWGYMLKTGGTTFWESFNAKSENMSLNHWTHSSIGEWLWRNVAGLNPDPEKPGYKGFVVKPYIGEEVNWCKASYESVRGTIVIDWKVKGRKFVLKLTVPAGSEATVYIPAKQVDMVTESRKQAVSAVGVKFIRQENDAAVFEVASGTYIFTSIN
jgi:alpha-L-rhamnosidase